MPEPEYLYKILDQPPPEPLPETLPLSALDAKDGFVHLSIGKQTPLTAGMFFGKHQELWILKLDREKLGGRIEWFTEPTYKIEGGCPHLHDSATGLGKGNVVKVIHATREPEQGWPETEGMTEVVNG